ncbi:hypothetical protein [Nostoc sp. 'Peltigera membranacea cyanobiont' N6]|uniref:hypothetical protein n=1 Tax=Nostoc sp. 'Peltigera membranacea cyanobiont' N6 TaxID=1261031 RepID=UPI000D0C3B41|nr:hypothetical protein [Nostoc sp. 'Peltigera membranacea cyanobiont' N6]AVH68509.1 hypothetical protein NPM_50025 [Nostoc sp. 'Peltigera membranacea cyanobiont' N6]
MKLYSFFSWSVVGVVVMMLLSPTLPLLAKSNPAETSSESTAQPDNSSLDLNKTVRAIRFSLMEDILKFVNNVAKTKVQLEWQFLPISDEPSFRKLQASYDARKATIVIPNNQLGDSEKWLQSLKSAKSFKNSNECPILEKALPTPANQEYYERIWNPKGDGWRQFVGPSIRATEYFSLLRDYNLIKTLLNDSRGVKFYFTIDQVSDTREIDEKVNWKIDVYEFEVKPGNNCQDRVVYYRYNIKALTEPFEVAIARNKIPKENIDKAETISETQQKVNLKVTVEAFLKKSPQLAGLIDEAMYLLKNDNGQNNITVILDNQNQKFVNELAKQNAANTLNTVFPLIGNLGNITKEVTSTFLGGTEDSSIITGGLIDFGKDQIGGLVGINKEFNPQNNISPGVAFGVGIASDAPVSLYVGPSIRASAFTLSAGANILEDNNDLNVNIAGLISVDVSRLLGNKKVGNSISIDSSDKGGQWYKATEILAKDLALLETTSDREFQMRRVCDSNGTAITDANQQAVFLVTSKKTLQFIPRGYYIYEGIPTNVELIFVDDDFESPVVINEPFPLIEDKFYPLSWRGKQSNNVTATPPQSLECVVKAQP